jgi:hypothetical protein
MKILIPEAERPYFVRFAFMFTGILVLWATFHDGYLIRVDARHFTEYHRQILPSQNHIILAIQYAVLATFGPALVYGFMAYFACRFGPKNKIGLGYAATGFIILISIIEILLLSIGHYARARFQVNHTTFYPRELYPELSPGIVFTQSVNLSAYIFAPILGIFYLFAIYLKRKP